MMDENIIRVTDFRLEASVGIYDHERSKPQYIVINTATWFSPDTKFTDDSINQTLNYEKIVGLIKDAALAKHYNLIETLAETIADAMLAIKSVYRCEVSIQKPDAFKHEPLAHISITLLRHKAIGKI
jgi:dihydroneopterin aldolase